MSKDSKKCVFCGNSAGSAEHVFPDWLSRDFGGRDSRVEIEKEGEPVRSFASKIFQHTVKSVCRSCNNGWMSHVEGSVSSYLGEMALGKKMPYKLDARKQRDIAIWSQKTFLVAQSLYPQEQRIVTPCMYEQFYAGKDVLPRSATLIGFNEHHSDAEGLAASIRMRQFSSVQCPDNERSFFENRMDEGRRVIAGHMRIGHVGLFMVASDIEGAGMEFGVKGDGPITQIIAPTPQFESINWPTTMPTETFGRWSEIAAEMIGDIFLWKE